MSKHCCVIGGGGFIGGYLVRRLAASRRVSVLDLRPREECSLPGGIEYRQGDYRQAGELKRSLRGAGEVVFLAYTTTPKTSYDDEVGDILAHVPEALKLFETAAGLGVKRMLVASSGGAVYGRARALPVREDHPTDPISPYGITKLAIEKYAGMLCDHSKLATVIVRPGNAYGPGQPAFSGQGFVATAIASILTGREIELYGREGTVRDYLHAADLAAGMAAALLKGTAGACYNIGTGRGTSNRQLLRLLRPLAKGAGLRVRVVNKPARPFDVPANILDSGLLRRRTGWRPRVGLEEGLRQAWEWYCGLYGAKRGRR